METTLEHLKNLAISTGALNIRQENTLEAFVKTVTEQYEVKLALKQ